MPFSATEKSRVTYPTADVGGVSPVPEQMWMRKWLGRAQSWGRCRRDGPSPDVAGGVPGPGADVAV
jgi:hypothetical protein